MSEIIRRSVHFAEKASNLHAYENYTTLNLFRLRSLFNRLHMNQSSMHQKNKDHVFTTIVLGSSMTMGRGVNGPPGAVHSPKPTLP